MESPYEEEMEEEVQIWEGRAWGIEDVSTPPGRGVFGRRRFGL